MFRFENTYNLLPGRFFVSTRPEPVSGPAMVLFNESLAREIDLDLASFQEADLSLFLSGNQVPPGSFPLAQAYAGHQFGHFTMLGDGRAHLLGEHLTAKGQRVDVQLKGSGRTVFSRSGDGRATMRAMLREYLISEAMAGLGIPSSRSLAVVRTGENVMREEVHPGAVLVRVAASHLRVGTFEFARHATPNEDQEALLHYALSRHFPEQAGSKNAALELLQAVLEKQADLLTSWMRVGFIHGVMNTDNMAISGETIDYGPCAFMNAFSPSTVFSSIDTQGRYAFGNQPKIGHWNLACLAGALLPQVHQQQEMAISMAREVLDTFPALFQAKWEAMVDRKLGFPPGVEAADRKAIRDELFAWMEAVRADYTHTFLVIQGDLEAENAYASPAFRQWHARWAAFTREGIDSTRELMRQTNPRYIPRNYLVEQALGEACAGDLGLFRHLLGILCKPYTHQAEAAFMQQIPEDVDQGYRTYCGT